jgi:hypothetical protein
MGATPQWRRWVPLTYAAFFVLAVAAFPAWIAIPVVAGIGVLYLMFSPVASSPRSRR